MEGDASVTGFLSRIAVGVRRAVAALKPHLVRAVRGRPLDQELRIESDATVRAGVELHHPALDAVGVELRVDGAVERVREVDATPVAADLHHLRAAAQRPVLGAGVRGPGDDAADPDLARE